MDGQQEFATVNFDEILARISHQEKMQRLNNI